MIGISRRHPLVRRGGQKHITVFKFFLGITRSAQAYDIGDVIQNARIKVLRHSEGLEGRCRKEREAYLGLQLMRRERIRRCIRFVRRNRVVRLEEGCSDYSDFPMWVDYSSAGSQAEAGSSAGSIVAISPSSWVKSLSCKELTT
jgi:hypothetical protein